MNNETNEPRVWPPEVRYEGKESLRRLPQKTTYPLRVWAAAASVAVMVGAGLALWSGTQNETASPIRVSQTIVNVAEPTEPTEKTDTTASVEVRLNATQTTKAKPTAKATDPTAAQKTATKATNAPERRMAVTRIVAERQAIHLSSVPPIEIKALATPQEPPTDQEEKKESKRLKIKFTNPFEALASDWKAMNEERAQNIERRKEIIKDVPNKFSNLFASFKLKDKEPHNENN